MSYVCPKCKSTNCARERRPDGYTGCLDCGYRVTSEKWDNADKVILTNHRCMFCGEKGQGLVEDGEHYCMPCRIDELSEIHLSFRERKKKQIETLQAELEYYRINVIESYELKLPVHKKTYDRAVEGLKAATKTSETSASVAAVGETKKNTEN